MTIPLRWIFAAFLAALAHELGHYWAVRLLGGTVSGADISIHGARMEVFPMSPGRELLCVLAGPVVSFSLLALAHFFPRIAICGLIQGIYNLLPIYPLDGGKALRCTISLLEKQRFRHFSKLGGKIPCKERKHRVQ
ncbi:MAG: metalloprotease [Faecousia sp.]